MTTKKQKPKYTQRDVDRIFFATGMLPPPDMIEYCPKHAEFAPKKRPTKKKVDKDD